MTAGISAGRVARSSRRNMGRCASRFRDGAAGRAGGAGAVGRTALGGSILGASGAGLGTSGAGLLGGSMLGLAGSRISGGLTGGGDGRGTSGLGGTSRAGAAAAGGAAIGGTTGGGTTAGGTAGSADGAISVAGSTVGASSVTTRGFRRDAAAPAVRRDQGLGSAAASPLVAAFVRVRGLVGALAATVVPAGVSVALARVVVRRVAGLIGSPLPGRIVRAGIRATGCERASRADCSSTELVKAVASIPAAWSRSRTSLVVRRNCVAKSYTRTVPTLPSSARRYAPSRFPDRTEPVYPVMTSRRLNSSSKRARNAPFSSPGGLRRNARETVCRSQARARHAREGHRYALRPWGRRGFTATSPAESTLIRTSTCCSWRLQQPTQVRRVGRAIATELPRRLLPRGDRIPVGDRRFQRWRLRRGAALPTG